MKGSPSQMKRICSSVALMMVAASAASTPGDSESLLPGNLPPCVAPAGDASDTEFDPCMISPVFSGCISTREALKVSQQALAAERSVTGQYRALMSVKNEQSRRYIATLDELSAVREKLDRCEATRGVAASNAISLAAVPDDTSSHPAGASGLAGELSKAQDILPNSRVAYPDYVSQIRALRAENRSLRLSLIAKDDQLVAGQKEVERPVADTAELEAPVKERVALSREDIRQREPLTDDDAGSDSNAAVEEVPPASACGGRASPGGLCVGRGLFTGGSPDD
ncbi:hypothetical protein JNO12_23910 [Erwinia aphidicola]|nr:hypothetical protein [Erwinia aphidicola]